MKSLGVVSLAVLILCTLAKTAGPAYAETEAQIRDRLCADMEREKQFEERRIQGKPAAIDCFNERYAIEIDWGTEMGRSHRAVFILRIPNRARTRHHSYMQ